MSRVYVTSASRVRGWILGNTKIGPVLDVQVCFRQGRYGLEVMIESLFPDRTVPWVRFVNGIDKYVTETSETISLESAEHRVTGKPVAKAKSRQTPTLTLSRSGRSSTRSGQTQNDGVQKYLESLPKYSVLVQLRARS